MPMSVSGEERCVGINGGSSAMGWAVWLKKLFPDCSWEWEVAWAGFLVSHFS